MEPLNNGTPWGQIVLSLLIVIFYVGGYKCIEKYKKTKYLEPQVVLPLLEWSIMATPTSLSPAGHFAVSKNIDK